MKEKKTDYPNDDPEKLNIRERLTGVYDHAGFYPSTRVELTEALTIVDDFSLGGMWRHLEFEVREHQKKARNRVKSPDAAITTIVAGYKDSAESAFDAYASLDGLHLKIAGIYTESLNPKLKLENIAEAEDKNALALAARYQDLKIFAKKGSEFGFNPLDINYLDPDQSQFVETRIAKAFDSKELLEIDDLVMEASKDQLNRAFFHTDALKMCRRFRARKAAGIAGMAVAHFWRTSPVPMDLDKFSSPAAISPTS